MTMPEQRATTPTSIAPATAIGTVALTVGDLERSVAFYSGVLGFAVLGRDAATATLGAGGVPLLLLSERPGAQPAPTRATGLFHFAIVLPSRADLGRWLRHWLEAGYPMPGQADHLVSEALYLADPDGNGIEIYRDRPRAEWGWAGGQVQMATDPLDIRGLLAEAERDGQPWAGLPAGTRMGHIHLKVGDVAQAEAFYHDLLGFDVTARVPGALFVSAGGYHHHIGLNTWQSRGAGPPPTGSAGLRTFTIRLPDSPALGQVLARLDAAGVTYQAHNGGVTLDDPWRNGIVLADGAALGEG